MPDSICMAMMFGLTATPQSTAQTTRSSLSEPSFFLEISATWATKVLNDSCTAMPRERPSAGGLPQPAFCAASSSAALWRGCLPRSARRSWKGSLFVARATSSRKHSVAKAVCVEPTERHHCTGTPSFGDRKSTRLNSSHGYISYAVFCLKKKNTEKEGAYVPRHTG